MIQDDFILEKGVWTEDDFQMMGWHDTNIRGMAFQKDDVAWTGDLMFDIDYIFRWNQPIPPSEFFTFWVAPCTLVFKEAFGLKINLDTEIYSLEGFEIADLKLLKTEKHEGGVTTYFWVIELHTGSIEFQSTGYNQIVRRYPRLIQSQTLDSKERGGLSFSQIPC